MGKVVLAYSGGLRGSVAIRSLVERGWDVVAVTVDAGQAEDVCAVAARARRAGAGAARVVDARARFVQDFVLPALRMNALDHGRHLLAPALVPPLVAEALVEAARAEGVDVVAHGCAGPASALDASLAALAPDLEVLAPVRALDRSRARSYALARDLPLDAWGTSSWSRDESLWGRAARCDDGDRCGAPAAEAAPGAGRAGDALEVEVGFEGGVPRSLDGERASPQHVIEGVAKVAGSCGFGRVEVVEPGAAGGAVRTVYEAPAALALVAAHGDLEALTLDPHVAREKRRLETVWAELVDGGRWHSPLRAALDAFAGATQGPVVGDVRLRFTTHVRPLAAPSGAVTSRAARRRRRAASYARGDTAGVVRLWSVPAARRDDGAPRG